MANCVTLGESVKRRLGDIQIGKIIKDSAGDIYLLTDSINIAAGAACGCNLENGRAKWFSFDSLFEVITVPVTLNP